MLDRGFPFMSFEETLVRALAEQGLTVGIAESCTGGLLSSRITEVPGASAVLLGSVVAYSNRSKTSLLGVPEDVLVAHGAVSGEAAGEMAIGARKALGADIGLSITCIAGPGGATEEKPVGLSYVGLSSNDGTYVARLELGGSRAWVREQLVEIGLTMVLDHQGVEPAPSTSVSLIIVADEILQGHTLDTNSNVIAKSLHGMGTTLRTITVVGDDIDPISGALLTELRRSRTVIVAGGLGPTPDDITASAVAELLGTEVVEDPSAIAMISRRLEEGHRAGIVSDPAMNDGRRKMAFIPAGATVLDNDVGYGPGCRLDVAGRTIFLLPGVPAELEHMLGRHVVPYLEPFGTGVHTEEIVHRGSESAISPFLEEVAGEFPDVRVGSYPDLGTYSTTIRFTGPKKETIKAAEMFRRRTGCPNGE